MIGDAAHNVIIDDTDDTIELEHNKKLMNA